MLDYSVLAILLLLFALALIIAEVFIPSGGMISIIAIVSVLASIWCAKRAWWEDNPLAFWTYIASLLFLVPLCIGGAFYILPRTSIGRKFLLEAPTLDEVTGYVQEELRLRQMVGQHGTTISLLNPGGLVLVDGERMHCESEGMTMLDPDEDVIVVAVKGNRLVVRQANARDRDVKPPLDDDADFAEDSPLDFDVPRT